jgi:hypothetical protein
MSETRQTSDPSSAQELADAPAEDVKSDERNERRKERFDELLDEQGTRHEDADDSDSSSSQQ